MSGYQGYGQGQTKRSLEDDNVKFDEEYELPFSRDYSRFQSNITSEHAEQLLTRGYTVIDNCFGEGWASALLQEIKWLYRNDFMFPNQIKFMNPANNSHFFVTKPNIYELDLYYESHRKKLPELKELYDQTAIFDRISSLVPELHMCIREQGGYTIKLQHNRGQGACFPLHYDNPGGADRRKITCLLYLNRDWKPGDGGEIRLVPFLQPHIDIEPRFDRMVLFMSDSMLHRVLPCNSERYCLTIWLESSTANSPAEEDRSALAALSALNLGDEAENGFLRSVMRPSMQRNLSRAIYEEEYAESIRECMNNAEGSDLLLQTHENRVAELKKKPQVASLIESLKALKP